VHATSQLGVAWRETDRNRWNALARIEGRYDRDLEPPGSPGKTLVGVASAHADYQPVPSFRLRGQLAGRLTDDLATKSRSTNASLVALRGTWDLHPRWDASLIGRTLFTGDLGHRRDGVGAEVGFLPIQNLRLATGYNVFGYRDRDLNGGSRSDRGFYIDFGFKLDEDAFRFLSPERAHGSGPNRDTPEK